MNAQEDEEMMMVMDPEAAIEVSAPAPASVDPPTNEEPAAAVVDDEAGATASATMKKEEATATTTDNTGTLKQQMVEFPVDLEFVDHFSLRQPSSTVRYRSKQVQIYDLVNDQLQLEHKIVEQDESKEETNTKTNKPTTIQVTMHRLRSGSIGLRLLRTIYTLVALLMLAYMLIFAAQAIAYQAMEIPKHSGNAAGQELRIDVMIATILSMPLLGYSMASLMVLATAFVIDCWNGHVLFALLVPGLGGGKKNNKNSLVLVEWFSFIFYIAIPVLTLIITNFMGLSNWNQIFLLTWYFSMNFSFLCFCALVFYHEINTCLKLTQCQDPDLSGFALITKAVLTTLTQSYCAVQEYTYLVQSDQDGNNNLLTVEGMEPVSTYITLAGRIKSLQANPCFEGVYPPQRRFALQELRESIPYVTNRAWSLERMCCKLRNGRNRFVVSGPNALDHHQYRSTLVCNAMGFVLSTLAIIALAMGSGTVVALVVAVVMLLVVGLPLLRSAQQLSKAMPTTTTTTTKDNNNNNEEDAKDDADAAPAFYQAWAAFTIAKPKVWYCWMRLTISVVLFFVWPVISLYATGLYKSASLFLVTSLFSGCRLYLDAGSMICESFPGSTLSDIPFNNNNNNNNDEDDDDDKKGAQSDNNNDEKDKTEVADQEMMDHARVAEILGKITWSPRLWLWYLLFLGVGAYFVYSGATSLNGEDATPQTGRETIVLVDGFYYPPQPDISYTTCELTKAYNIPGQDVTYTMDYNLLAGIAYETTNVTKYVMDKWFGQDEWVDEIDFVIQWKKDKGYDKSPVSFRLFSKTSEPGVAILSIRGTETPTDALFNVLLYASSFLTHFARILMPFSWFWEDIYPQLIATTSWIASDQLKSIGYYQETTAFANDLLRNNYSYQNKTYNWLRTTGVSLGGGLALITGAQSDAFGLGIAGMNPVDARLTFEPPLEMDRLNTQVLNIIPETDFISNMGTKVRNFDTVGCRTWPAKRYNCHSFWRIFCEYMYSCGTPPGKPAYCICVDTWGYPEPLPRPGTNQTFAQACAEDDAAFRAITGGGD